MSCYKILLDKVIDEEVEKLPLSNANKNHSKRFIKMLIKDGRSQNGDPFSFTDKPYNYLSKGFGNNYKKSFLDVLISEKLVEVDNKYSTNLSFSKKYKVSENLAILSDSLCLSLPTHLHDFGGLLHYVPSFLQDIDYQSIASTKRGCILRTKKVKNYMNLEDDFVKCVSKLHVDFNKIEKVIENYVNSISPRSFNINHSIKRKVIPIKNLNGKSDIIYFTKENAIKYALENNVDIIEDFNGTIFATDLYKFVYNKKHEITENYLEALINLDEKNFYASRNETNNRLDTNLTNFPSILLEVLLEDNNLVEIDLCNSQFAIFSHLIPKEVVGEDVDLFKTLSQECELYPYLQEKMALSSRKEAKIVCFEICFSSHKNHSQYVTEMRKLFPNVMMWVDDFKKQNGDNQFAIMLQKKEAEIFIDNLYVMIREEDIFCLTKHDSLIVKSCDEFKVRNIIEEYFKNIEFKATIR